MQTYTTDSHTTLFTSSELSKHKWEVVSWEAGMERAELAVWSLNGREAQTSYFNARE